MFEARTFRECLFFELDFELHYESGSRISKSIVYKKITDSARRFLFHPYANTDNEYLDSHAAYSHKADASLCPLACDDA